MIHADEDALICDMAETYGVFNWRGLPAPLAATLAAGLPDDSRIKRKLSGVKHRTDMLLLASAVDKLAMLVWLNSSDGAKGINRPESVLAALMGIEKEQEYTLFDSPEDFMQAYHERMKPNG